ncbi:MAG: hypothetical protein GQ576_03190 [Methanococcoides sp.]|nr:hypothetical protein [Methanococcoides sp.]
MTLPDGTIVHKIGMCNTDRSTDRMMELLRSWFMKFRFVPYTELKLDMETGRPFEIENHIHKILEHKKFAPSEKVSGGTEMFVGINEFRVLQYLRHCDDNSFDNPLGLSKTDYKHLGQLISP